MKPEILFINPIQAPLSTNNTGSYRITLSQKKTTAKKSCGLNIL